MSGDITASVMTRRTAGLRITVVNDADTAGADPTRLSDATHRLAIGPHTRVFIVFGRRCKRGGGGAGLR